MNILLTDIIASIPPLVASALAEDIGTGDISAELIPAERRASAYVITREDCVVCGQAYFNEVFAQLGDVDIQWLVGEGDRVNANTRLVELAGSARVLLTGERCALNFLQTLSGTATTTAHFVHLVKDAAFKLLDTRKTIPGLRLAQKYAVAVGGGFNHRIGLYDAFLIKENHIAACGSITQAITQARLTAPNKPIEVEVETLLQLQEAIAAKADRVMLDNFT
ncbi:MAG: carboxylating nicotinate-nucleotide diphosphorylase, partial [Moraxellaceae bacterium]